MEFLRYSAKTVSDAITEACKQLSIPSSELEYEVIEEGSTGFLGFNSKPAVIRARVREEKPVVEEKVEIKKEVKKEIKPEIKPEIKKEVSKEPKTIVDANEVETKAKEFLVDVLKAMKLTAEVKVAYNVNTESLDIDIVGKDMGVLIGKRGQTLDSLQYLVSLVVNKGTNEYIRVKVDTENYRNRRKETLENLAKNISYKVKRTKRSVSLEPMNPYERRIIHSALQNDKFVTTHSEGEEPFRRVVVTLKK